MPNGDWTREGAPVMMVPIDSARLFLPRETLVACNTDHTKILKLKRGESSIYPSVRWAIKQALVKAVEEQATVCLSRLQLPSDIAPERPDSLHSGHSNSQNLKLREAPHETEAASWENPQSFVSHPHWQEGVEGPHETEDAQSLALQSTSAVTETASSLFER